MSEQRQRRHPRPSRSEREQRRITTQVNLVANQLPQVNQDFLNLARTQLEAFNQLQREGRQQPQISRSRSPSPQRSTAGYRQRPRQHSRSSSPRRVTRLLTARPRDRTPPTPQRPSSPAVEELLPQDSETLSDAPDLESPAAHSPTPSVIGWDNYVGNRRTQTTDRYTPDYSQHSRLPRHHHAPERSRYRGARQFRGGQRRQTEPQESRAPEISRAGAGRGRGRRQRPRSLHERIRF
jgi:hypothetical protein